jgi:HK97 family phage prohead protease
MPTPNDNEEREEFLKRCMGDETMTEEYPDEEQRYAVCNDIWRRDEEKDAEPVANYQRAVVNPELKASNAETQEVAHLISTASIDRGGDIVEPGGVDLANFLRNPVVMRNHSYQTQDIIGKATSISVEKDGIWARTTFRDTEVGREAFALSKEGLGGWSIGFRPIEYESIKDDKGHHRGVHFKTWELLEYSQVPIPMNADAVQSAVQRGLVSEANVNLFFKVEKPQEKPEVDDPAPTRANAKPAPLAPGAVDLLTEALSRARRTIARDEAAGQIRDTQQE